jgi:hypothetical protein
MTGALSIDMHGAGEQHVPRTLSEALVDDERGDGGVC